MNGEIFPVHINLTILTPINYTTNMQYKIMIIDDEKSVCLSLSEILQEYGYATIFCLDPQLALTKLATETINLVLLDIRMPKVSGVELLRNDVVNPKRTLKRWNLTSQIHKGINTRLSNGAFACCKRLQYTPSSLFSSLASI